MSLKAGERELTQKDSFLSFAGPSVIQSWDPKSQGQGAKSKMLWSMGKGSWACGKAKGHLAARQDRGRCRPANHAKPKWHLTPSHNLTPAQDLDVLDFLP